MAKLTGFDANKIEPIARVRLLPPGDYVATIIESVEKVTRDGSGSYLSLTLEIIEEGEFYECRLWDRVTRTNKSAEAVQFGNGTLSAICRAVGVMKPTDSTELHDLPLVIHVESKPRNDTGEIVNAIRGYCKYKSEEEPADGTDEEAIQT
jgi:hypothetical protein